MERKKDIALLQNQIEKIETESDDIYKTAREIILLCRECLLELREKLITNNFLSKSDEIYFFKVTKQIPLTKLIYYSEIQAIEASFPAYKGKAKTRFIKSKIKKLSRFFITQREFAKYIRLNQTHFDEQFFTRKYNHMAYGQQAFYILDPIFHTSHDSLLAKLKAYELLNTYLYRKLSFLKKTTTSSSLKWTSSKVSLTELIYALHHSKSINDGEVDIKEIAKVFQDTLNIDLSDLYRTFSEIRNRKKGRVKYLDELAYTLRKNIEVSDG